MRHAVAGKSMSGVTVATIRTSTASGPRPRASIRRRTASAPITDVVSPGAPTRRSRMPVRVAIHSSEVSRVRVSSALVTTRSGT